MSVLDRKRNRDVLHTKGMLLAVASIVAVGSGSFIGMLGTYNNLDRARRQFYAECRLADFWIDLKKAPVNAVTPLAVLPGLSELRTRIVFPALVDLPDVARPINATVLSMPDEPTPVINGIVIRRGSAFTAHRRNEAIVSEKFAAARGLKPGDNLKLILDGQEKRVVIVGTAIGAEFVYSASPGSICDDAENYGLIFLKRSYLEEAVGFHGACNSVVGLLTPEARARNPSATAEALADRLEPYGVFMTTILRDQFSNLSLSAEMGGLQSMATMMPLLFLSVAALVLNVFMMRIAQQQRTIVGTLKALGYGNRVLFLHYLQYGGLVGLLGGLGGCAIGFYLSGVMTGLYQAVFVFPGLHNAAYPGMMVAAVVFALVFALLGALHGVRTVTALPPAEAMREPAPPTCGAVFLERFPRFWNALDFRWQMILRGLLRNRGRTLIALGSAALGAAMVVVALGLVDSMNRMIDFQFEKVMKSDYVLSVKDDVDVGALYEARTWPGVLRAEPVFQVAGTFVSENRGKRGVITGLRPDAELTRPHDAGGEAVPVPPVGLLMTERMAGHLGVRAGDTVRFTPVRGVRRPIDVPVVRLVRSMLGLSVYADARYLNRLMNEVDALSTLELKTAFTPDEETAFFRLLKRCPLVQTLSSIPRQKVVITKQFDQSMKSMAMILILFAAVIDFGSMLNGALIAIAERRREIATFQVLGYPPAQVGALFLRENMLTALIGSVLGMPLGYVLLYGLCMGFTNDAYSFPTYVAPATWIWTFALGIVFVLGAHAVVHRSILKLNWAEALSMKE